MPDSRSWLSSEALPVPKRGAGISCHSNSPYVSRQLSFVTTKLGQENGRLLALLVGQILLVLQTVLLLKSTGFKFQS